MMSQTLIPILTSIRFSDDTSALRWRHGPLDFDGTAQSIHDACEFDQNAIARGFDDPTVVLRDFRVDELVTDRPQPSQRPLFIGSHETAVSRDIGRENGGEPALHARVGLTLG